ncbi:hypothetical protein ACIQ9R_38220 [Streptomyces sp. NPDC094447]|uniref:hypothetical protein n=1 Tax=Streptomyces sp. NPDC094447 TaxID=3366062 RepID=UPI003828D80C
MPERLCLPASPPRKPAAGAAYIAWRHPSLGTPLTVAAAFGALAVTTVTAVIGVAALRT